ncbi:MAG: hypothetical protein ABUS47_16290 [Steroidobacter sp.]
MKYIKAAALGILLLINVAAHATPENTLAATPHNFHVYDQAGDTYVDLVSSGCSAYKYYIDPNLPAYKTIVSILLTAEVVQREVVIKFDGCNSSNQGQVVGVYLP